MREFTLNEVMDEGEGNHFLQVDPNFPNQALTTVPIIITVKDGELHESNIKFEEDGMHWVDTPVAKCEVDDFSNMIFVLYQWNRSC